MGEVKNVSSHVLKMKSHIDHMEILGSPISSELATDLILNSLTKSYETFIMNYNMNSREKPISELHVMLKTAEKNIPNKPTYVLLIREGGTKKTKAKNFKGKGKKVSQTP